MTKKERYNHVFRRFVGVICFGVLIGIVGVCIYKIEAARRGLSIGAGIVLLMVGATWGLSKKDSE